MRDLTDQEAELIYGANTVSDGATIGGAVGGALGISYATSIGGTASALVGLAGYGAAAGAGLGAAFTVGYALGGWLNENTPIQSMISDRLPRPGGFSSSMS